MGGCSAVQAGWGFLCGAGAVAWQVQSLAGRVVAAMHSAVALGPLPLALLLLLALAALAVAWHLLLYVSERAFPLVPWVLAAGLAIIYLHH